jgi:hypothetical protein
MSETGEAAMPLIEAALAFAITMLALSLVCSSILEVFHRSFRLREKGLEYMLGQLFDSVLSKYQAAGAPAGAKQAFVAEMTANRAPLHAVTAPAPAPAAAAAAPVAAPASRPEKFRAWLKGLHLRNLWSDRRVKELSLTDFMDRLGSLDLAKDIKIRAVGRAAAAGVSAADAVDLALKDIAQKFDGFGRDAGVYFEARARIVSVVIAIVLAFVVHVDAVDLFRTYLRDPNARAKVIEQTQAVTAQYKAAKDAADALKQVTASPQPASEDVKAEIDKLKKEWSDAIGSVDTTVKEYTDLGMPLGWTPERVRDAKIKHLIWFCPDDYWPWSGKCAPEKQHVLFEVPTEPRIVFYLLLGGLLIGLGSPFWYDVVTNLTNLRKATQSAAPARQVPSAPQPPIVATNDKPQPVTPVGAFDVAQKAAALRS